MKKRAGLARALALDPELLFLDEPTAGLDPISANQFDELIRELAEEPGPHRVHGDARPRHAAARSTDRIAVLVDKKLKIGTIDELRKNTAIPGSRNISPGARGRAALASEEATAMETKANYVAVGAFVLACVIGLVVTMLWLAGVQYSQEYAYYQAYLQRPGDRAWAKAPWSATTASKWAASPISSSIPTIRKRVIVTLQVQPNLKIRNDSVASIESQGLTGGSYVEISGGTADRAAAGRAGGPAISGDPHQAVHLAAAGAVRAGSGRQAQYRGLPASTTCSTTTTGGPSPMCWPTWTRPPR